MTRRTCPTDDQLRAFQTGSSPDAEAEATAAHVRTCPRCLGRLDRLAVPDDPVLAALRGVAAPPTASPAPDDPAYLRAVRSAAGAAPGSPPGPAIGPGAVLGEDRPVEPPGE